MDTRFAIRKKKTFSRGFPTTTIEKASQKGSQEEANKVKLAKGNAVVKKACRARSQEGIARQHKSRVATNR